ncbi:MAG: PAS domain S-box protein [Spirochaetales bacterium]|nr:PAS domain S-box protein [Spirochaetales bacterium]
MLNNLEFYIRIFENSADGLFLINDDGRINFVNERCTELVGRDISDILNNQEDFLSSFKFDNGGALEHTFHIKDRDAAERKLKYSYVRQGKDNEYLLVKIQKHKERELAAWTGSVYKHLYYNLPDPVVSFDIKGNIITANPAVTKLLGWTRNSIKTSGELYSDKGSFIFRVRELVSSKGCLSQVTSLKTLGGGTRKFYETIWPHFNEKYELSGFTAHYNDLSREDLLKAQLEVSQTNYNRLFENFTSSIVIVDELGGIVNMNSAAEGLYEYSRVEVLGEKYDKYFSTGADRPTILELIELTRKNGGKYIEIGVPRTKQNGEQLYTYVTYYMVELSGEGMFALFVLEKDLTTRIRLEKQLEDSFFQLKETQAAAIMGFAKLTEFRDHCTGEHLDRIKLYTKVLATALKKLPEYSSYITDEYIEDLSMSSILHDIGKVGIEDSILLKAGKLSEKEFEIMKNHSIMGGHALSVIDDDVGHKSFLTIGKEVASYHHEKWDGSGYPEGLIGRNIPLSARIVALADVYDALISERPYKHAFSHEEAEKMILDERGIHFDPDIVDAFTACSEEFFKITQYGDGD